MKNKKNEPSGDLVAKPSSFSHKNSIEFPEEVRFDIGVFAHSRTFFPDGARQNLGSPLSVTSASRESLMVFASAIDIKKGFHSRNNSIPTPLTPQASSPGIQFQTKASLNGGGNIDYSDLGINTEFQTTMYTSMTSNQKKDFTKFTPYAKDLTFTEPKIPRRPQTHNTARKAGETISRASRNSSIESITNSYRSPVANDTYKKGLNNFFNPPKKPAKKAPRPTMMFQGFAQFQSQPSSPVSKKSESVRSSRINPQKPSTAGTPQKPTNTNKPTVNRGGLSRSQKLFNNKASLPSSLQNSIRDIKDDISRQETAMYTNAVVESRSVIKRTSVDTFGTKNLLDPNENNNTDTAKLLTLNSGCLTIREDTIEDDTTKYRAPPATTFHGFINALNAVAKSQSQLEKSENQKKTSRSRKSLSQSQTQNKTTPSLKNGVSEGTQTSLKSLSNKQQSKVETTKTKESERIQKESAAETTSTQTLKIDLKDTESVNKNARFSPAQDVSPIQALDASPITLHQESNFGGNSEGSQTDARRLFGRLSIISTKNPKILESKPSLQLYLPENNSPKANSGDDFSKPLDDDKKTEISQPQFPSATVSVIEKDFIQEGELGQGMQITPSASEKEIILMTSGQQEVTPVSNKKEAMTPASQLESSNKLDEGVIEHEEKEEVLKVEEKLPMLPLISNDDEREEVVPMPIIEGLKKLDLEDNEANAASILPSSADSQEGDREKEEVEENKEVEKEEDGVQPKLRRSSSLAVFSRIKRDFQPRNRTQVPKSPLDNNSLSTFKNLFADFMAQRERKSSREMSLTKSPSQKQNAAVAQEQEVQEKEEVTAPNEINIVPTIQEDKDKEEEPQEEEQKEHEAEKHEHVEEQFLAKRQESLKKRNLKLFIHLDNTEPPTPADQFGSTQTDEEIGESKSAGYGNHLRVIQKQVSLSPNHLHSAMNSGQERKHLFRQQSSSSSVTVDKDGKLSLPFVDTNIFSIVSDRLEPRDEYMPTITIKEFDEQSRPALFNPSITEEESRKSQVSSRKDSFDASYKKAMFSSQKNGKRSNTLEIDHLLSPSARSLESKTARKSGYAQQAQGNSPVTGTAEDYIQSFRAAQKKVSWINNGRSVGSGRELTLLRSIMKENEGVMQIEGGFKNQTTQAFLSGRLRSPTARTESRAKTFRGPEQPSAPVSPVNNDEQGSGMAAQKSARSDEGPKKEMKRSKTQKSVFAKKEGEKMDVKQFTVKFDIKRDEEGNTPKAPRFSFKNKPKRKSTKALRKRNSVLLVNQGPTKKVPDDKFLAKLNGMNFEDDLKDFTTIVTPKLRIKVEEPTPLLKGGGRFTFEPQKTFDFSTLLQNDDDDSSRGFGFNMSKAGSVRSDVSKMMAKEREKENKKNKLIIKVFPPESEEKRVEREHKEGAEPQEDQEGVVKYEFSMKGKSKGSMENDLEFSRFENFDDLYENDFNGEVYLGTLDKISSQYDWDKHVEYFSHKRQKTRFLKYYDAVTSNHQTFLMKYHEDKIQRYEHMITADEVKPNFALAFQKIMKKTSIIIKSQAEDVIEDSDNEEKLINFKEKTTGSISVEDDYEDDIESNKELLELNGIRGGLNYPAFSFEVRRKLKRGAHIISQIDDRIQAKIFEHNGHTVEDYIMLNGLNIKEISRMNVHHKIAEMMTYSADKNFAYIAKLEGIEYKDLLSGHPQCNFLLKVLELHQVPISSEQLTPLQRALPERRRLEKVEKFSRAPSLKYINAPSSKSLKSSPSTSPVNNARKSVWAKASLARRKISMARQSVHHDSRFEAAQAEEQAENNDPPVLKGPKFRLQRQLFVDLSSFEKEKEKEEKEKEKDKAENKIRRGEKLLELTPLGTPTNRKPASTLRRLVTGASGGDSTPLLTPHSPSSSTSEKKSFGDRSDEIRFQYYRPGQSRTTPNSPHGSNSSSSPKEANSAWSGLRQSSFRKKNSPTKEPTFLQRVLALGRTEKMHSPSTGVTEGGDNPGLRTSLKTPTIMPYASRSPSKFKQVVEQLIKKNENKDKFKAVRILLNETGKSFIEGESMVNTSKMHAMQRKGTLIRFDTEKLKVFREKKMDKGSLKMRTQAHSQQKKKHLTLLQQTFMAVKENKIPELHELFLLCPTSLLDRKDSHGDYLIGIAAQCGFMEVVKMLLDKNVNVNFPNAEGNTPLHLALAYGHYDIADRLLARGADQNVANNQGRLPWDLAQQH